MRLIVAVMLWAGCVSSSSVPCADGTLCPTGDACLVVAAGAGMRQFCVSPDQVSACSASAEGASCTVQGLPGTCHSGACLASACGNGIVDFGEVCDDGNTTPHDGCSPDCASSEVCGNRLVDVAEGEQCDLGDQLSHDGCSSTCRIETLESQLVGIDARNSFGAAYDLDRRSIVVFGGSENRPAALGDTLEWDGRRWHMPSARDRPLPRAGTAMAYDQARHQVVMFSGAPQASDTWTFDGTWTHHTPATSPPARTDAGTAYDPVRKVVVVYGGTDRYLTAIDNGLDDTWEWNGTTWTQKIITGPPGRALAAMAYDPKRNVIVLYGGVDGSLASLSDLWEYDGIAWTHKTFSGPSPLARWGAAMAFDPVTQRMMLVGGYTPAVTDARSDAWEWDGTMWTLLGTVPNTPSTGIAQSALVTDPVRGVVVLLRSDGVGASLDLLDWNGTSWSPRPTMTYASMLSNRQGAAVAYDSRRARLVVFGGSQYSSGGFGELADTLTWDGAWHTATPTTAPSPRATAVMAYDPVHDAVILFGGELSNGSATDPLGETWMWKNDQWTHLFPFQEPGPRREAAMAYDAARGKIVMFGGVMHDSAGVAVPLDETWTWDGMTWHLDAPAIKPSPRGSAAMAYDPVRQRVVMFGGGTGFATDHDTWTWDGQNWTPDTDPNGPAPRMQASLAWDASRERLVLVGGRVFTQGGIFVVDDVWEWDGTRWAFIAPTSIGARSAAGAAPAIDGAGIVIFGGIGDSSYASNDTWRLRWSSATPTDTCADVDADGDGLAGCADPDCWWRCGACLPGTTCGAPERCGDGVCDATTETCATCSADCGACAAHCGDGTCGSGETVATCPGDCSP